jgi:HlyD family secretion protein
VIPEIKVDVIVRRLNFYKNENLELNQRSIFFGFRSNLSEKTKTTLLSKAVFIKKLQENGFFVVNGSKTEEIYNVR